MHEIIAIIPTYNEEKNILKVLDEFIKLDIGIDFVVVDDGSSDETKKVISDYLNIEYNKNEKKDLHCYDNGNINSNIKNNGDTNVNGDNYKIYRHLLNKYDIYKTCLVKDKIAFVIFKHKNEGKSKALESGTKLALSHGYNYVVYMDGDYQHKPRDIPKMYNSLKRRNADAVFGIRNYENIPLYRQISNFMASILMSIIISIYSKKFYFFKDIQCGFRIIKSDFLKNAYFGRGYSVEHIIALQLAKKNAKIIEELVEIDYHPDAKSYITLKKIIDVVIDIALFVLNTNNHKIK